MDNRRPTSWMDWYSFARRQLEYEHSEAVAYANIRFVEDVNKRALSQAPDPSKQPARHTRG
jgi:hypothetical protein